MNPPLASLLLALRLYSRWPLPARAGADAAPDDAHRAGALAWLPAVGIAVAVPAAIAYVFAGAWLPHTVALLAAILVALLLSGAVHERGLARWIGPAAPQARPDDAWAMPAIAVALLLLARIETLSAIDPTWIAVTLVCAAAFSRGCAVLVEASLAAGGGAKPARAGTLWALAWAVAPSYATTQWTQTPGIFLTAGAFALLASAAMRRMLRRRARARDDGLGAVQTVAEIAFLLGIVAALALAEDAGDAGLS